MTSFDNRLWFIVLNYNNFNDSFACIQSIYTNYDNRYKIILVDNNSNDNSAHKLMCAFPDIVCLLLPTNGGYAVGNNAGVRYAIEHGAEYICVLNNDVIVPVDFIGKSLISLKENTKYDIIAPIICEFNRPNIVQSAGAMLNLSKGSGNFLHHGENVNNINISADSPNYLGGACFIVRKNVFSRIGLLPEFYFLFYEETDWFFTAHENGINFGCDESLKVYHKGSASIRKVKGLSRYYLTRNQVIFERRKAKNYQFVCFLLYSICRWIYYIIKKCKSIFPIKAFCDGLMFDYKMKGLL